MNKNSRQFAIKEIISTSPIGNQDELRIELKRRGFDVTQATLSRDISEMGIARVASENGSRYIFQPASEVQMLRSHVGAEVLAIVSNETMVVVKTLPGCANVIGEYLDAKQHPDIIGTLAGDNTLLVIPASQSKTKQIVQFLKHTLIEG